MSDDARTPFGPDEGDQSKGTGSGGFDLALGLSRRGVEHAAAGENEQAEGCFRQALALDAKHLPSLLNLANMLMGEGRRGEAVELYQTALSVNPNLPQPLNALGHAAFRLGFADKAAGFFKRAVELNGDYAEALSNLIYALQFVPEASEEDIRTLCLNYGKRFEKDVPRRKHDNDLSVNRPLRIGYLSADFRMHPRWFFFRNILAAHRSGNCRIFCYSTSVRHDQYTRDLMSMGGEWRMVARLNDEQLDAAIRKDKIDILVEMTGHQGLNRLPLMARKPAPVQVHWQGWTGTTGMTSMDYVMGGELELLPGSRSEFVEKLVRLPLGHSAWAPPGYAPPVGPLPCIENGFTTFGAFCQLIKIQGREADVWSRILQEVPNSRLLIKAGAMENTQARERVTYLFKKRDIDLERLILVGGTPHGHHLAELNRVDIGLDSMTYSGCTSSCDQLFMGVPVLTLPGRTWRTRHTPGLNSLLGMKDWIARDEDDYVARAVHAAGDTKSLGEIRKTLRRRFVASPICDAVAHARHLEAVYRMMWQRHVRDSFSHYPPLK